MTGLADCGTSSILRVPFFLPLPLRLRLGPFLVVDVWVWAPMREVSPGLARWARWDGWARIALCFFAHTYLRYTLLRARFLLFLFFFSYHRPSTVLRVLDSVASISHLASLQPVVAFA